MDGEPKPLGTWHIEAAWRNHGEKATNPGAIVTLIAGKLLQFSPYSINKLSQNGVARF